MDPEFRKYARVGYFLPTTLWEVSNESFSLFKKLKAEIKTIELNGHFKGEEYEAYKASAGIYELEDKLLKESIKSIIFLGAFLESYFFDYSAEALGQKYTEKHIERIDLISKIVLIPKLITGHELNQKLGFFPKLKELTKWRNRIVHNKTQDALEYQRKNIHKELKPIYEQFKLSSFFGAVKALFNELERIDPKGLHIFRSTVGIEDHYDKYKSL